MKKKGFQLSISVLVVIILGIVMVTLGIVFLNSFISKSQEIKEALDQQTEQQLKTLLDSGQKVAISLNSLNLERGNSDVVGIGVLNIDRESGHDYRVEVSFSEADNDVVLTDLNGWVLYDTAEFYLESYEQNTMPILFSAPRGAATGQYIFDVRVLEIGTPDAYGVKKVIVTVS